jgi:hypothetical protein
MVFFWKRDNISRLNHSGFHLFISSHDGIITGHVGHAAKVHYVPVSVTIVMPRNISNVLNPILIDHKLLQALQPPPEGVVQS